MSGQNKTKQKQREPTSTPTMSPKFGHDLKNFHSVVQQFCRDHSEGIKDIDGLKSEIDTWRVKAGEREKTIAEKDKIIGDQKKEIAQQEKTEQLLITKFQKRTTQMDAEKSKFDNQVEIIRQQCEKSSEKKLKEAERKVQLAETNESEARASLATIEKQLREVDAARRGFQDQLEDCNSELDALKKDVGMLVLPGDLEAKFDAHEAQLRDLALRYCGISLPADQIDSLFMLLHQSGFLNVIPHAVPILDTKDSALLRAATLEAYVTRLLAKDLFQPLFPWSSPPDEKPNILEELFDEIHDVDPRKEAILRSIINKTKTQDGDDRIREAVVSIRNEVTNLCTPFLTLSQPSRYEEFQKELEKFLLDAVEIWNRAQRSQFRVMASSDCVNNAELWIAREEHDPLDQEQEQVSGIKALYPSVYQVLENESLSIHNGGALWSDQLLYTNGRKDFQAQYKHISSQQTRTSSSSATRRLNPTTKHRRVRSTGE